MAFKNEGRIFPGKNKGMYFWVMSYLNLSAGNLDHTQTAYLLQYYYILIFKPCNLLVEVGFRIPFLPLVL